MRHNNKLGAYAASRMQFIFVPSPWATTMLCHRWHGLIKYGIAKTKIEYYKIENSDQNSSKCELLFATASLLHQTHTFRYQW